MFIAGFIVGFAVVSIGTSIGLYLAKRSYEKWWDVTIATVLKELEEGSDE